MREDPNGSAMVWWWIVQVLLLVFCWPLGLIMLLFTGAMYLCRWLDSP